MKEEESTNNENKQDKPQPQCFVEMQQSMEDELERRRKDWEKDVELMQHDFFQPNQQGGQITSDGKTVNEGGNHISSNGNDGNVQMYQTSTSKRTPGGTEMFDISKALYDDTGPESSKYKFRLRFDVCGFEPRDIRIRSEGGKVSVSAKHQNTGESGSAKTSRQFNRQVDIPENVDPDRLTSYLSPDGVLTVEAPYESGSQPSTKVRTETRVLGGRPEPLMTEQSSFADMTEQPYFADMSLDDPRMVHHTTRTTHYGTPMAPVRTAHYNIGTRSPIHRDEPKLSPPEYRNVVKTTNLSTAPIIHSKSPIMHSTGMMQPSSRIIHSKSPTMHSTGMMQPSSRIGIFKYNNARIEESPEGRKLRLVIDLGAKYNPDEIQMRLVGQQIMLQAKHEEKIGGRTSRCEFSREFELPEAVEARTLRAMMAPDGMITVGASVKDNQNHDQVLEAVLVDMPSGGRSCTFSNP